MKRRFKKDDICWHPNNNHYVRIIGYTKMSDFPYKVEAIGKLEKGHVRKYESSDEFLEYKKSKLSEVLA